MRARSNPWLALIAIMTGGAIAVLSTTAGCGSKADEGTVTPPDTGNLGLVDAKDSSAQPDTKPAPMDTEIQYDVPGSLFDANIPDMTFEGGKTLSGCYDCTTDQCKAEVAKCDAEPRCRGLVLCILTKCGGNVSDFGCALGCGSEYGVSSLSDPVATNGLAVGQCVQNKCKDACPIPTDGGAPTDARTDAPTDATTDATTDGSETSAFMIFPNGANKPAQSMDPELALKLTELAQTLGTLPAEARANLLDTFSAH